MGTTTDWTLLPIQMLGWGAQPLSNSDVSWLFIWFRVMDKVAVSLGWKSVSGLIQASQVKILPALALTQVPAQPHQSF